MSDIHHVSMATIIIVNPLFSSVDIEPPKYICVFQEACSKVHQQQSVLGMCITNNTCVAIDSQKVEQHG